jgi:hypothetical protein
MRRLLFTTLVFVLVAVAVEGAAHVAYRIMYGRPYDPMGIAELAQNSTYLPRARQELDYLSHQVIHPYLGFVGGNAPAVEAAHGFYGGFPPETPHLVGGVVALLMGGSVAMQVAPELRETLGRRLSERAGREVPVRVFVAALGGFKQPQQLMALNYLALVGFRFDLVINLDGYNEIVLPWADNVQHGVHPFFPRRWDYRIDAIQSVDELALAGEIVVLKRRKQSILRWREEHAVARSAVVGLVLSQLFVSADRRIGQLTYEAGESEDELSFEASGPSFEPKELAEVLVASTELWKESSLLMDRFAKGLGVPYLHVLQPNQYLAGSKPLSDQETSEFYVQGWAHQDAAGAGYPLLVEAGRELAAQGIAFHDATQIFAKEPRTTYSDACCHLNELGIQMLSDLIVADAFNLLDPASAKSAAAH